MLRLDANVVGRALGSRDERAAELRALIGRPAPMGIARAIRLPAVRAYERHVLPLVREHWPALDRDPFGRKLRFLTCDLYACAPYTVLFLAPNRPWSIRAMTAVADTVPISARTISRLAELGMSFFARSRAEHRRIALAAAFIAAIDHAFDHMMEHHPRDRGRRLRALLDGSEPPSSPALALVSALFTELSESIPTHDRRAWDETVREVGEWIDAEVAALMGAVDETGLCHRAAGVRGTIDGVVFPLRAYVDDRARAWLYDVSMFVQMMDDWIDFDLDVKIDRVTPVVTGRWTFRDIASAWRDTVEGIERLARDGGLERESLVGLIRENYVSMMSEVMDAMIDGIAD